jgi:signal transduction histidine kinase
LLYNAINHTQDDRTITVKIADVVNGVRVSVINPGEEIPKEERELIWERYQRSQHQGGRKQGTGIGLSIVSALLKSHGMPYGVDCHDDLTVFWFECPKGMLKTE